MTDAKVPGLEERFAEIKGVRMRYFVGGDGPPLVLVHGLGGAASNWTELAPLLLERHRLLVPDLPGHGGSTALPAVGVPSRVPVPLPWPVSVTPSGRPTAVSVGIGKPVAETVMVPAEPTTKMGVPVTAIAGAWSTVSVNACVAAGSTPFAAVIVRW